MGRINIYTTGGELVEGSSSNESVESNLIETLGVIPPWQACYCNPENGILIHIFTAKKRDSGSTTRKANNYYGVYTDPDASQSGLFDNLANELTVRFNDETTGWERVPKDHLKSPLSDPTHIATVPQHERWSRTLGEQAFVSVLEESDDQLHLSFDCIESFRECVGLAISSETHLRYATELKSVNVGVTRLIVGCGGKLRVSDQTANLLSSQFNRTARLRRHHHIERIEDGLERIEKAIENETVNVITAIDTLKSFKSLLTKEENLTKVAFNDPILADVKTVIESQWSVITRESAPDIFDRFPQFESYKIDFKRECKRDLSDTLQSKIESLESMSQD